MNKPFKIHWPSILAFFVTIMVATFLTDKDRRLFEWLEWSGCTITIRQCTVTIESLPSERTSYGCEENPLIYDISCPIDQ